METDTMRELIRDAAHPGRVWPNGIGYDWQGWEFTISEPDGAWCALRRSSGAFGKGATPQEAQVKARLAQGR